MHGPGMPSAMLQICQWIVSISCRPSKILKRWGFGELTFKSTWHRFARSVLQLMLVQTSIDIMLVKSVWLRANGVHVGPPAPL
jgi:phage-related holin